MAIDPAEVTLGELRVRACSSQAVRLLEWAAEWPERTWAVEGAGGLGQLVAHADGDLNQLLIYALIRDRA